MSTTDQNPDDPTGSTSDAPDAASGSALTATQTQVRPRSRAYRNGELVAEDFPLEELSDWLDHEDANVWFDLPDPTPQELKELAHELGLHTLAVEDAIKGRQRPKVDRYDGHQLFNAYAVRVPDGVHLQEIAITAFITKRALVTVHRAGEFDIDDVVARWDNSPDLACHGCGFLIYGLLDHVVDSYFDALQVFDDEAEELSDQVFDWDGGPAGDEVRRLYELRRSLLTARRVIGPMREVINSLIHLRQDLGLSGSELTPYYQDVYDHAIRAADWTDNLRDLIGTIRETQLTIQSNRMNLIMKKVTSWAAIIAVPTAVTGFYGQNVPYPGFSSEVGFWTSTGIMIALSVGLYIAFRLRDWL
ncbi:MAG TPA: magnesium transporter CorA family protein [Actinocrinis sp.]|nr:magnesium transporter CorA family protein [Actinocrinis sp.]